MRARALCAAGKAMELFLHALAAKAVHEAKTRKSKMLTASHLCVAAPRARTLTHRTR
jgi:hypothetical protein